MPETQLKSNHLDGQRGLPKTLICQIERGLVVLPVWSTRDLDSQEYAETNKQLKSESEKENLKQNWKQTEAKESTIATSSASRVQVRRSNCVQNANEANGEDLKRANEGREWPLLADERHTFAKTHTIRIGWKN